MNTYQLTSILTSDQSVGPTFLGVFPIDKLPKSVKFNPPCSLIVNFDPSSQPGSHWVAIFIPDGDSCEYFDSYGRDPPPPILTFLKCQHKKILKNNKQLQSNITSTCGQMCVYYLIWRSRGIRMYDILQSLTLPNVDELVTGFVNGLFKINTRVVDEHFFVSQLCEALDYKR